VRHDGVISKPLASDNPAATAPEFACLMRSARDQSRGLSAKGAGFTRYPPRQTRRSG
jgi:hypothetical protein